MLLISVLIAALVIGRAVLPCAFHWRWKLLLGGLVLASSFKFFILRFLGGANFFNPDLPAFVQLPAAWCHGSVIAYFVCLLLMEIFRSGILLYFKCKKTPLPENWRCRNNCLNLVVLLCCMLVLGFGIWNGVRVPAVKTVNLEFAGYPAEKPDLKIALLADLHIDAVRGQKKIRKVVEKTNALNPDVILIAGDFADGSVERLKTD